jgi:exodeoxyribonuclease X
MKTRQLRLPLLWRLSDTAYTVVDVETTGLDHNVDRVVEVAAIRFESGKAVDRFETLVDPGREIPAEASEQHHLIDADVAGAPSMEEVEEELRRFVPEDDVVVAHNAAFDRGFLPCLDDREWVCSARAARHAYPDLPRHRNQFLRYSLKLDAPGIRKEPAHRAAGDAIVTGHVFHRLLKDYEISHPASGMADFMAHVASPVTVTTLRFGRKHYGEKIAEVPTSYLEWMIGNVTDLDGDLSATITAEIARRSEVTRAA